MSAEVKAEAELEIAHILFIDTVGYSKLLSHEQRELLDDLNTVVRSTSCFRVAEAAGKLIRLPTGDGMALVFSQDPEAPVRCALEICRTAREHPRLALRMGIHSGPVSRVVDVNDRVNIAGGGINTAQRVMSCGDAGHILLSKRAADDLAEYGRDRWQPYLHELGECEVKHGTKLTLVNLYTDDSGNPELPAHLKQGIDDRAAKVAAARAVYRRKLLLFSGVAAALIAGYAAYRLGVSRPRPLSGPSSKSIAVLPFENLTDDKQNAYLADGIVDEILTNLAKVADLKVISRTSVMQYKTGTPRNLRDIAADLGVAHVLEGTVQRSGGRIRVSAQLIDARNDAHIWAQRYDTDLEDIFAVESELAEQIVAQLKAKLSPEEKAAIEQRPTSDLAAYELYIRAKNLMTTAVNVRAEENLLDAARLLNEAVTRDPAFFLGYYLLASVHDQIYLGDVDRTPARLALADAAVKAAIKLQPNSGEAHLALAEHLYCGYLDYDRARQEIELARRTLPNEPRVYELAGYIDRRQGRWDESTTNLRRALELDPHNFYVLQQIARSYEFLRDFRNEAAILDRALAIAPNDAGARLQRAAIELSSHANTRSMHSTIEAIVAQNSNAARGLADDWLDLALCERDETGLARALAAMPPEGSGNEGFFFPRDWFVAVVARARGDDIAARAALNAARITAAATVEGQPDYGPALCVLGLIDAGLGHKEEAIREGRRAVELLPVTKDAINGALLIEYLAVIYATCGDTDRAIDQLSLVAEIPSDVNYGQLKLHPRWDPLRGNPRFENIIASLAPKQ